MIGCLSCGRRNNFPYCLDCRDNKEVGKPASDCLAGDIWRDEMASIIKKSRINRGGQKRNRGWTNPEILDKKN